MNILIYNFDSINPLAHEWAHLLVDSKVKVTLVNHRETIKCQSEKISVNSILSFKPKLRDQFDALFLPWIPSREYFIKFCMDWARCGFPPIIWIDHNPIRGRDREGLILKFLRKSIGRKVWRITHGKNFFHTRGNDSLYFPHPIFMNAFEGIVCEQRSKSEIQLNLAFIGRLDEQKGFFELPRFAESISEKIDIPINWIIAGNNHNLKKVQEVIDSLKGLPKVSVEAYTYGKKCPDEYIMLALKSSDFLLAPYKQITSSGTISLAIALGTEVISMSNSLPIGLEAFYGNSIHCIKEDKLIEFLQAKIRDKRENVVPAYSDKDYISREHNEICAKNFIKFVEFALGAPKNLNQRG
jgi:glycosyltransferase involved in cell wall biosynthesis